MVAGVHKNTSNPASICTISSLKSFRDVPTMSYRLITKFNIAHKALLWLMTYLDIIFPIPNIDDHVML